MSFKARKRFGQNFLHDAAVIHRIIETINPKPSDCFVEIGPGLGALTFALLTKVHTLTAIELDRDLIPNLEKKSQAFGELIIHQGDALEFDFASLYQDKPLRLVGNLPYNISTPLIFHLLSFSQKIYDMHFMLQKEVVDRICARPNTESYGRLSVMVQYHCETLHCFDVPPTAFTPEPKVNSSIVKLVPYQSLPFKAKDYSHFAMLVKQAFSQRRKTLRNCLKNLVDDVTFADAGIDPTVRAEALHLSEYVKLSNLITKD